MGYQQIPQMDSVKAARRYSRALRTSKHRDEQRAKNAVFIAAVLLCILMTTFSMRTSGRLRRTVERLHAAVPAHIEQLSASTR
jgi:hypothetical protein